MESHKLELFINDQRILRYEGRRVKQHHAFFYQVLTDKSEPFHFYIKLKSMNKTIALNVDNFSAKIDKAVAKAKKEIAIKYNLSVSDIDNILEKKREKIKRIGGTLAELIIQVKQNNVNRSKTVNIDKYILTSDNDSIVLTITTTPNNVENTSQNTV